MLLPKTDLFYLFALESCLPYKTAAFLTQDLSRNHLITVKDLGLQTVCPL